MPLPEAQRHLDHLTACSPCYRDFLDLQARYRQRRTRLVFAVAASVLIVVGLATWAMLRQHNQQMARAIVDLRDRSMARGTERPPTEPPLEMPRNVSHLEIYLPLGSSEGTYDLRVISARNEPLYSGTGSAKVNQGVTVLNVDLGMSLSNSGDYFLLIRRSNSEWVSFPLRIP
jgi:hypothetical protein